MKKILVCLTIILFSNFTLAEDIPAKVAVLMGMDKVSGRTSSFRVEVGKSHNFNDINVKVKACFKSPDDETPENKAFLEITDKDKKDNLVFKGWMFSSTPSISALDHDVYDIWIIRCEK